MNNFIYYDYASSSVCKVQEDQSDFVKASNIPSYLNQLCLENGSSLQGRKDAYKYIMHQSKFIPIRIHSSLIYFPTKAVADGSTTTRLIMSTIEKKAVPSFF